MRRNYNRAYLHFVWATWDRQPLLMPAVRDFVYPIILSECAKQKCRVEAIGGVEDHIHLVVHFSPTASFASLMKATKGASSNAATDRFPELFFKWQGAYGVESVSPDGLPAVIRYVQRQREHHADDLLQDHWERTDTELDEE